MRDISKELQLPGGMASTTKVANIDPYYGVFASVEEAKATVPDALKEVGRQFAVYRDGSNKAVDVYTWGEDASGAWIGIKSSSEGDTFGALIRTDNLDNAVKAGIYRQENPTSGYDYTSTLVLNSQDGVQQLTIDRDGRGIKYRTGTLNQSGNWVWTSWKTVGDNIKVANTLTSDSTADALSAAQGKVLNEKVNPLLVNQITITTAANITTNTVGSYTGLPQNGRNVRIDNGVSNVTVTCKKDSNADFIASYTKLGNGVVTFDAESGVTLKQVNGTATLNGIPGSSACVERFGDTFFLYITNV